jgi:transcriptional regulator with XRE-family HTH domain
MNRNTTPGPADPTALARAIRDFRRFTLLSRREFAHQCDVSVYQVAAWERSEAIPRSPRLLQLAQLNGFDQLAALLPRPSLYSRRRLTPATRQRISEAQTKRWAESRQSNPGRKTPVGFAEARTY